MTASDDPPHTLRSRRVAYDGTIVQLRLDRVVEPDGREHELEVVHHPGSVVIIAMPDAAHVYLVSQYRHAVSQAIWELPAGRIDPGESVEEAAGRECEEEIGLRPGTLEPLGVFAPTPGYCDERMAFFRATDLREPERPAAGDVDERLEPRLCSLDDALALARGTDVVDLKTIAGLALLRAG